MGVSLIGVPRDVRIVWITEQLFGPMKGCIRSDRATDVLLVDSISLVAVEFRTFPRAIRGEVVFSLCASRLAIDHVIVCLQTR